MLKRYVKNILVYLVALFGLIAFLGMFTTSLQIYDGARHVWVNYKANPLFGYSYNENIVYHGAAIPVIGFILPLVIGVVLVIESFKPQWGPRLSVLNTVFSILLMLCSIMVLLTKELYLVNNGLGSTSLLRNGIGPILAACCSFVGAIILLVVTWMPSSRKIEFIDN